MTAPTSSPSPAPTPIAPAPTGQLEPLASQHTSNFPEILNQLGISLAVSTYQAGRLVLVRSEGDRLNTHFRTFDRPMGLATQAERMAIGCGLQVWEFYNVPAVAEKVEPHGRHDSCYLPRWSHVTGDIDIHEMSYAEDGTLWLINTRFCCLCTLEPKSSFFPRWRPKFISSLAPEDRCHLNGLAIDGNVPTYATSLGTADTPNGWRENKARGGALHHIPSDEIVLTGLSMPHSPRLYRDKLWLQESGDGSFGYVDLDEGKYHKICEVPGFTRGLDFAGPLAFMGLSQVRESAVFSGIPLVERLTKDEDRTCGVFVVNIETGQHVAFLKFTSGVQEIFAVRVLPNQRYPELLNETTDLLKHAYILPDEVMSEVGLHPSTLEQQQKAQSSGAGSSEAPGQGESTTTTT